jgi:hypothetical protein
MPIGLTRGTADAMREAAASRPADRLDAEAALPEDGIEADGEIDDGAERDGPRPWLPGPLIAAASFVPTFLAVFFGLSHLLGDAVMRSDPAPSAIAPVVADLGAPTAGPDESRRDWIRAAALPDHEAARRVAATIRQGGYPVEIRPDPSSTRSWVVWIGPEPRGGRRRR